MAKYKVVHADYKTGDETELQCKIGENSSILGAISRKFNIPVLEYGENWCSLGYEGDESGNIKNSVIAYVTFDVV